MPSLDLSLALKAADGDLELLGDVVQAFMEEYPVLIESLRIAIPASDFATIQRASHTIKGTLRLFGNTPARELAQALEDMGQKKVLSKVDSTFASLITALETLRAQLVDSLQELHSGQAER